jgi:CheY-like chemotaxis protein
MGGRTVNVLLVEDNIVDQEGILRAFRLHRIANPVHIAVDGAEALALLRGEDGRPKLPRPFLVLLDLNLPRMTGIEFLKSRRADPELRDAIVFVLTTSKRDEDRVASYDLNVAGYMVKGDVGAGFLRLVEMLEHFWRIVEFP